MTSWDYYVGFEREPVGLKDFLKDQGYDPHSDVQDGDVNGFESREGGLVDIFYSPKLVKVEEGEVPDWSKSGRNVTSDLLISTKDSNEIDEAQRLTDDIVREYDGISYDIDLDDFFESHQL